MPSNEKILHSMLTSWHVSHRPGVRLKDAAYIAACARMNIEHARIYVGGRLDESLHSCQTQPNLAKLQNLIAVFAHVLMLRAGRRKHPFGARTVRVGTPFHASLLLPTPFKHSRFFTPTHAPIQCLLVCSYLNIMFLTVLVHNSNVPRQCL
jgi:hypothetical protein